MSITGFKPPVRPITNITPFTLRDGSTYLEYLETMAHYINDTMRPEFDGEMSRIVDEFNAGVSGIHQLFTETDRVLREFVANAIGNVVHEVSGEVLAPEPTGANDSPMLQELISQSDGKLFKLRSGMVYKIDSGLDISGLGAWDGNGATLNAKGMPKATALAQVAALNARGTINDAVTITSPIAVGSNIISDIADTVGFREGDLVLINNNENPVSGLTRTDRLKGELHTILSVDSGTRVTLDGKTYFGYGLNGLKIRKLNHVELKISNTNIICGADGSGHNGVIAEYGRNVDIDRVDIKGGEDCGIQMLAINTGSVNRCHIADSTSSSLGTTGYGVAVVNGSKNIVVNGGRIVNSRHLVAGGGRYPATNITVNDVAGENGNFDCHESTFHWTFNRCTLDAPKQDGFLIRGQHITVRDCTITNSGPVGIRAFTWDGVDEQVGLVFEGNKVYGGSIMAEGQGGANPIKRDITIRNNKVYNVAVNYAGYVLRNFDKALFEGNTVDGVDGGSGIYIVGLSLASPSKGLTMRGNTSRNTQGGSTRHNIQVIYVNDFKMESCTAETSSGEGISIRDCFSGEVVASSSKAATFYGMKIERGGVITVTGGEYSGTTSSVGDGIRVTNSTDITVTGTKTKNPSRGIYITGTNNVIVTGNNARENGILPAGDGTKRTIEVDAAAINKVVANNL